MQVPAYFVVDCESRYKHELELGTVVLSIITTRSPRANETKTPPFAFESGKDCRGKQIEHSYSKFQKKSNGVFSGFLSLMDPEKFWGVTHLGGSINMGFREKKIVKETN